MEQIGFSLRIYIPTGDPEGIRVIDKSQWTGQGVLFPRAIYDSVKQREELENTGVYILWDYVPQEQLPRVYIGESDNLKTRLDYHNTNKDFWTHCVVFISKDRYLTKAHIRYLEARLVGLAKDAKRCELDSGTVPQIPSLAPPDRDDAELYLRDMLLCLPVLGVRFFEKPSKPSKITTILHLSGKGVEARGYEESSGFTVLAGSQAVKETVPSIPGHLLELRGNLQKNGILQDTGSTFEFGQDYTFGSLSAAAGVIMGLSANGRKEWKKKRQR